MQVNTSRNGRGFRVTVLQDHEVAVAPCVFEAGELQYREHRPVADGLSYVLLKIVPPWQDGHWATLTGDEWTYSHRSKEARLYNATKCHPALDAGSVRRWLGRDWPPTRGEDDRITANGPFSAQALARPLPSPSYRIAPTTDGEFA